MNFVNMVSDRFRLIRMIGAGGMGIVYEAEDRERGEAVALKTLMDPSPEAIYRLKREFRALTELNHPNLIPLYELFVTDGCFFTMELIDGVDFLSYVQSRPVDPTETQPNGEGGRTMRCSEELLGRVLPQLAGGLMALHAAGKVHRDVKPSNILVTKQDRVVILDFGLVIEPDRDELLSQAGEVEGTIQYMAPEQAIGSTIGSSADWYAIGVLLYQALTGCLPFEGLPLQILVEKQERRPPAPQVLASGIPDELDELCVGLLARDPLERFDGADILRLLSIESDQPMTPHDVGSSGPRVAPFAGRESQLAAIESGLEVSLTTQASAVLVTGASGIGKSALVRTFISRARDRHVDMVVLQGRCYERETVAYGAMDSLIDDLSSYWNGLPEREASELLPREAQLLQKLFPVLGRVSAVERAPRVYRGVNPQERRDRAFGALRELFGRLADRHPLVLFLDDLHWVDANTLLLLADLMRAPDPPNLLLVLASWHENSERLEALLEQMAADTQLIRLEPLSEAASIELATTLLGADNAEHAERIAGEADGNPFFIEQLAEYIQSVDPSSRGPVRLEEVLEKRISELSDEARKVLEFVVLAGEPIEGRVLAGAAELPTPQLERELRVLRGRHFIRTTDTRTDGQVEPFHDRVRDAVLSHMTPSSRQSHHRGLALALGEDSGAERLARHWQGAGENQRAAEYARRAADDARDRLDFNRSADLYQMALALGSYAAPEKRSLLTEVGSALANAGRPGPAAEHLLAAAQGAEAQTALELRRRAAEELLRGGYLREGLEQIREVLAEFGLRLAASPFRAVLSTLLRRAWIRVRGLGWREREPGAKTFAEHTLVDTCYSVTLGLGVVDTAQAADYQSRHALVALRAGDPPRVARALATEAMFHAVQGNLSRARMIVGKALELSTRLDDPYLLAVASAAASALDFYCTNRWRNSVEKLSKAGDWFRAVREAGWELDNVQLFNGIAKLYLGELEELDHFVPTILAEAERRGDRYQAVCLRTRLNLVWLARDDTQTARAQLNQASDSWMSVGSSFQVQHFFLLYGRCELALYLGDAQTAAAHMAENLSAFRWSMLNRVTIIRIEVLCLRGRIALAQAATLEPAERKPYLRIARTMARKLGRGPLPLARAWAPMLLAGVARLSGNNRQAQALLRTAVDAFEKLEMRLYENAVRDRLGELLDDDEGATLREEAKGWYAEQGVRNPERMTAMLVPG